MKLKSAQTPIAIVGLACRLPGNCNTPADFWKFVLEGHCASCEVPPSRFSIEQHYDGSLRTNTMRSPGGMFINVDPKDLDAGFFALSQTDAISMDPNQRQLLEVVYEGLENAGLKLESLKRKKYGCFVGSYASGKFCTNLIKTKADKTQITVTYRIEIQRIERRVLQ
jgi:acyl transferase domain-containing protein